MAKDYIKTTSCYACYTQPTNSIFQLKF